MGPKGTKRDKEKVSAETKPPKKPPVQPKVKKPTKTQLKKLEEEKAAALNTADIRTFVGGASEGAPSTSTKKRKTDEAGMSSEKAETVQDLSSEQPSADEVLRPTYVERTPLHITDRSPQEFTKSFPSFPLVTKVGDGVTALGKEQQITLWTMIDTVGNIPEPLGGVTNFSHLVIIR